MKRTLILVSILALVAGVYFFTADPMDARIEAIKADRDFAVAQDLIGKVVITEKNGDVSTLTHKGDIWFVNNERINRNQHFLVMEALTRIKMESIPPKGANKQIMKTIAKIGILVKVYNDAGDILKSYHVGGVPQGERGTYYLMEGSNQPYLMQIPGMQGSTRGRFIKNRTDWLDRAMFRFPAKDISEISVEYPRSKNNSYKLIKKDGEFLVEPMFSFTPKINKEQNSRVIEDYLLSYYKGFFTEAYVNDHPKKDSIVSYMKPYANIVIKDDAGKVTELNMYPVNEVQDMQGVAIGPDVDKFVERYYVNVNQGENFMLTQQILAKKFLWGYDYFFR